MTTLKRVSALILVSILILTSCKKDEELQTMTETETVEEKRSVDEPAKDSQTAPEITDSDTNQKTPKPITLLEGNLSAPDLGGYGQPVSTAIGEPGVDFNLPETGPANDWDPIKEPLINPLGSKVLYGTTKHYPTGSRRYTFIYVDGINAVEEDLLGEGWQMTVRDDRELSQDYLRWYADDIGAKLYDSLNSTVVFRLQQGNELWWCQAIWKDPDSLAADITIIRQQILPIGETITVTKEDLDESGAYRFVTQAPTGDFISAKVDIEGDDRATGFVVAYQEITYGRLEREFSYRKTLAASECRSYSLDDIPQTDGILNWAIEFDRGSREPESITFTLNRTGSIKPFVMNDSLGCISIEGAAGSAKATNQSAITDLKYTGGFSYSSISDGENRKLFYLPSGYYNIHVKLPGGGYGGVRMVPVTGGETTQLILPEDMKSTYSAMEEFYGDFETNKGSIIVEDAKDLGETAKVTVLVNDPLKRDIFPELDDVTIYEGAVRAEVTEIIREPALSDIVLVIDTSGSMQQDMQNTIDAAKRFVDSLPEGSNIRLVSFAQTITAHEGNTKTTVRNALETLNANGGTALYDAAYKGLALLAGSDKPYLVLFSDGADSRELVNMGKGSDLTLEDIVEAIGQSKTTVLTIGFGEGQDTSALKAMSAASENGALYSAKDSQSLDQVFASVAGKFGNQFVITYNRPTQSIDINGEKPVVNIMMDDSGSMSNYRDSLMNMFHHFLTALPKDSLIQFSKFGSNVDMMHMTTDETASLMQAMGEAGNTGGGTEIISALNTVVSQLKPLPTNKKVMIFITDSAMDEVTGRSEESTAVFERLKEEGIRCLFVGVSDSASAEDDFKYAAEGTDGNYVISTDIDLITAELNELLKQVSIPLSDENLLPFGIGIQAATDDGSVMDYYSSSNLEGFTHNAQTGTSKTVRTAQINPGLPMLPLFSPKEASLITGGIQPSEDTLSITSHVVYDDDFTESATASSQQTGKLTFTKTGSNGMMTLSVSDAYTFDTFFGVQAEKDRQFLALHLTAAFDNMDANESAYRIPNMFRHFYLSLNDIHFAPASKATWIAEKPLGIPGQESLQIAKGSETSGILVFYTQKPESTSQLGLHYYDTVYGHIQIPLSGKLPQGLTDLSSLPKTAPVKLSESYSMTLSGFADELPEHGKTNPDETRPLSMVRTVEATFTSKVQALLNVDPLERFFLGIETDQGPLLAEMSPLVHTTPLGFTGETLLAPGVTTIVRMPFETPEGFGDYGSFILADLKGEAPTMDVVEGPPLSIGSMDRTFSHDLFDVTINSLSLINSGNYSRHTLLDITVHDKPDGYGTRGLDDIFMLTDTGNFNKETDFITPAETERLIFAIDNKWYVKDGQSRRGLMLFKENDANMTLVSPYFMDLRLPVSDTSFEFYDLLAEKSEPVSDSRFKDLLLEAVHEAVNRFEATRSMDVKPAVKLVADGNETKSSDLSLPSTGMYGQEVLSLVDSDEAFIQMMYGMACLPSRSNYYFYAPEAVLAQGWGSQHDLAVLGIQALTRLGYQVTYREVELTQAGEEALNHVLGVDDSYLGKVPVLSYLDASGRARNFVIPFMRDANELGGLVYFPLQQKSYVPKEATADFTITASLEGPDDKDNISGTIYGAFAQAAGTSSTSSDTTIIDLVLFERELSLPSLSLSPIDIGYVVAGISDDGGNLIQTVVKTAEGTYQGDAAINTGINTVLSTTVTIDYSGNPVDGYTHTTYVEQGESLTDICHALALNLPEMTEESAGYLETSYSSVLETADGDANNATIVRWYTHGALYRYITARTSYDREMAMQLDLVMGRVTEPASIMVTAKSDGTNATAAMDLMHHYNQIIDGEEDYAMAYRLYGGFYASVIEGHAMSDASGVSILDVWAALPEGTGFYFISDSKEERQAAIEKLSGTYPEPLIDSLTYSLEKNTDTLYFVPKAYAAIGGEQRMAWFEIDGDTMDALSVFDTGERSGMAEYVIGVVEDQKVSGYVGFFVGISCGAWSISSFSLIMDDYEQIKTSAAAFCGAMLARLEGVISTSTDLKGTVTGKIKDKISVSVGGKEVSLGDIEGMLSPDPDIPTSFAAGYRLATELYFGLD